MSKIIITLSLPRGCESIKAIDNVLNKQHDKTNLEPAVIEYEELLKQGYYFQVEDFDVYKNIRRKFEGLSIHGYTDFGMELARKYPNSQLIKLINKTYSTYGDREIRTAMVEFNILQEVVKARIESLKMRGNQTYHGDNFVSGSTKQNFSQTMKPGQVPYDSKQSRLGGSSQPVTSTDQPMVVNGQRYIHENMYRELENRATIQENDIKDLQKKVREKDKDLDDLRNRLSGFASKQLTEGNPDFTDLSDKNRPTKIAEFFHNIYDDEWTTALEALTHAKKGSITQSEEDAIIFLMEIIQNGYEFCKHYSEKQEKMLQSLWNLCLDDPFASAYSTEPSKTTKPKPLPGSLITELKQRRKVDYTECMQSAVQKFKEEVLARNVSYQSKKMPAVDAYIDKCIEVMWLMSVQDPPMAIRWAKKESQFDGENYKEYCKKGRIVKITVWPAVFLHEKGVLMNKGFVMPQ